MQCEKLQGKKQEIDRKIDILENQLKTFPKGKLICTEHGGYSKWYQSDGQTKNYIPKKNRRLAEQLAAKKYLTLLEKDLQQERNAIESFLKHQKSDFGQAEQLLAEPSEYQKLLSPFFKPISKELLDWQNSPFTQSKEHPEQLIIKASSGNIVRSKSEALIDMFLYKNKIPFRYECELYLGRQLVYPDFTIRHPKTGKLYYWEHFGMMDDNAYVKKTCKKLYDYSTHGIIPSVQLITTYETKNYPLTTEIVEEVIEHYFGEGFM